MKRKFLLIIWLLAFISIPVAAGDEVEVSSIHFDKEQPGGSSSVLVDFPLGDNQPVRRTIIDFILERCKSLNSVEDVVFPSNTCNEVTFGKFLEEYTTAVSRNCADDQHDYAVYMEDESYEVTWFSNLYIQKVADTSRYVSYSAYHGEFIGGAHDARGSEAVTIRKTDGARIDSLFVDGVEEKMQPLLWKYLIESENPDDSAAFRNEINQFLEANYGIRDYLHLPYGSCYLAPDGVHILYQPLEICFWPGEPEIVIPPKEAKPFLTKEARQLLFGQ